MVNLLFEKTGTGKRIGLFCAQKLHAGFIPCAAFLFYNFPRKGFYMYQYYQPNPQDKKTDDCVIRALTKALGVDWDTASIYAIIQQIRDADIYTKNYVWGNLLLRNGYSKHHIPDSCPDCYTVRDFCDDHGIGMFIVGTGDHVLAVVDGDYYDSFDSGDMVPIVYYRKEA